MKRIVAATAIAVLSAAPAQATPPIVGGQGLVPDAAALAHWAQENFPGITSIGGVRADPLPDHPSGHALDLMIGTDMALGDQIAADVRAQASRFGVKYVLWRVPQHFNHVHVTVF